MTWRFGLSGCIYQSIGCSGALLRAHRQLEPNILDILFMDPYELILFTKYSVT